MIAIEILSPEDRLTPFQEKAAQYRAFGIENIWIVDPERRIADRHTEAGFEEQLSGELTVKGTPIRVVLSEMFAELDRV
jgi:Uma2 family endonuclease